MRAFYFDRIFIDIFTLRAYLWWFKLLNIFQLFIIFIIIGVVYSLPTLSFSFLELLLELPPSFIIGTIMNINTAISKDTISRVMPIFAQTFIIVESAGVLSCCTFVSCRAKLLVHVILWVLQLICIQLIVSVPVHAPINFLIKFPFPYFLGNANIFQILFLRKFSFRFIHCLIPH